MRILAGQPIAQKLLEKNLQESKPFHAYLFEGPEGTGKLNAAIHFSCILNGLRSLTEDCSYDEMVRIKEGSNPDIRVIQSDGASVKIEQMREMIRDIQIRPFQRRWKIFIIQDADRMSLPAANSVLKVMEEPPPQGIIILTTAYPAQILPTIRSRCQIVPFRAMATAAIEEEIISNYSLDVETAHLIAGMSEGLPAKAAEMAESPMFEDFRRQVIEEIERVRTGTNKDIVSLIRDYERDKNTEEKLRMWSTIIRDILVWRLTNDVELLYHRDKLPYYESIRDVDTYHAVESLVKLEKATLHLQRNVNSGLALRAALGRINKVFKGGSHG